MPRKRSTHCRYCEEAFKPGDNLFHGAHMSCHNNRPKFVGDDEDTRAAKAKDIRRRVIAALAKRNGITKEEAEKRYNARKTLKCGCGAEKTRLALRCPACNHDAINARARVFMADKRTPNQKRAKAKKVNTPHPVTAPAPNLPAAWTQPAGKPKATPAPVVYKIINPGVPIQRAKPLPGLRESGLGYDIDPAKEMALKEVKRKIGISSFGGER